MKRTQEKWKKEIGITLIALVVTIVVLLILAGITINLLFSNGGIFNVANQAKIEHEIGALKDRINNVIADWSIERLTKPGVTVDDLWNKMVEADIIDNPEEDVAGPEKEGENDVYQVTTNEGYVVEIIVMPDGSIVIGDVVKEDSLPPKIGEITSTSESNSIHIEVEIARSEGEVSLSYYYKKDGEAESSYKVLKEGVTDLTADFTGLEQKVVYNIKVVIKDNNGTSKKEINVTTGELTGTVTQKGETIWNDGTASIELETTKTGVTIQYQIDTTEGQWQDYEGTITGLKHGGTVFAVVTDGTNQSGYSSINILDEEEPQQAQIELSGTTSTTVETITATVTHIDNESGVDIGNCRWVYNTNANSIGTNESSYPNKFSNNGQTIDLTATTEGTYYLHVLTVDKAGRKTETISQAVTVTIPNAAPVISAVNFNSKTENSITIDAQATDADNNNLTYTLYTSTSENGSYSEKAKQTANANTKVSLQATGLNMYTSYYYYVTVTDGIVTTTSSKNTVKTYCKASLCTGPFTQTVTCPTCNGTGGYYDGCTSTKGTTGSDLAGYASSDYVCSFCGGHYGAGAAYYTGWWTCDRCGYTRYVSGKVCSHSHALGAAYELGGSHSTYVSCPTTITQSINCSHGKSSQHYYCSTHGNVNSELHE